MVEVNQKVSLAEVREYSKALCTASELLGFGFLRRPTSCFHAVVFACAQKEAKNALSSDFS